MSSTSNDLRVLVVSNDPLARAGLASLLAEQSGCTVVGQMSGEADLPGALEVFQPDVLVWDWDPNLSLERLSDLSSYRIPIVALLPDETSLAEAQASGAQGLLLRDSDTPGLVAALTAVTHGLIVLDPSLAAAVPPIRDAPPNEAAAILTPREQEVLAAAGRRAAQQVHRRQARGYRTHREVPRQRNPRQAWRPKPD